MSTQDPCCRESVVRRRFWLIAVTALLLVTGRAAASVTITASDATSGKPLDGVHVVLGIGSAAQTGTTDTEGKCKFNTDLAGAGVAVQKEGWCPLQWDCAENPPGDPTILSFKLKQAATIGGLIEDQTGKGVSGVQIFVNFPQRLWGAHIPVEDFPIITDAQGHWTADFVPGDAEYIHLELIHSNYVWEQGQPSRESLMQGRAVLTMEAILALQGRVLNPEGQPVPGATVLRGQQWGIMGLDSGNDITTDTNGWFHFPADKPGNILVAAFAPRFGPVIKNVELAPASPPVELTLTVPHTRKIRVTDEDGKPLPNLKVQASQWQTVQYPPWEFKTDADGRIVMTNAPADEIQMDFLAPHRMGLRFYRITASETEQVVQLGPELRLHGKVTDARTGKPVPSFQVIAGWPRQVFNNGQLTNQGAEWGNDFQKKSFHGGAYDWTFEEPVLGGTDKPYDFLLRVDAGGYAPAVSRAFKATEKDAEFDFQLAAPSYINGSIHFADGSPAAGASIYLVNQAWDLNAQNGKIQNMRHLPVLTTEADGSFKLMEQQAPPMLVVWHENGFATMDFTNFLKTNQIILTKWGGIEGTLWRGNHLAVHERVALSFEPELRKVDNRHTTTKPQVFYSYETTTDESGHFVFDKVPPGAAAVTRVEAIPRPNRYGLPLGDVWAGCRLLVVKVPEGETVTVKARGSGRTVTGRFVSTNDFSKCLATLTQTVPPVPYPDGLDAAAKDKWAAEWFWSDAGEKYRIWLQGPPQTGASMYSHSAHSWAVKVGTDGSFEIPDVPDGAYTLRADFLSSEETGGFGRYVPGLRNKTGGLTYDFMVQPGDNLSALPPQDLGTIGDAPPDMEFPVAEPSAHEPVTVAMKADHAGMNPGETFQLVVRVRIAEGHHIYGPTPKSKTFTGTSVSLDLPAGVEAVSDWSQPAAVQAPDGELIYTNSISFSRSFKTSTAAGSGPISLKGGLHYQVCNDQLCWPPKTIPLSATLAVGHSSNGTP
jgi:hypothetical protein